MGKKPIFTHPEITKQSGFDDFILALNENHAGKLPEEKDSAYDEFVSKYIGRVQIESRINPEGDIFNGETKVPLAVFGVLTDDLETTKIALEANSDTIKFGPHDEGLAHLAVKNEVSQPLLQLLKDFDHDLDQPNKYGETAYFYAATKDDVEVGKTLVDLGADATIPDTNGKTPLFSALENNANSMVKFTGEAMEMSDQKKEVVQDAFRQSLFESDIEVQQTLANHFLFADVKNKPSLESMDEVLMASWQKDTNTVKSLAGAGFSLDVQDSTGRDPLEIAQITGNTKLENFIEQQMDSSMSM